MKVPNNQSSLFVLMLGGIFLFMLLSTNLSALIYFNTSNIAFEESETGNASLLKAPQAMLLQGMLPVQAATLSLPQANQNFKTKCLSDFINESATNFLESYSNLLLFLRDIEASEANRANHKALLSHLEKAIEYLEFTKENFSELTKKAGAIDYNKSIIEKLEKFNYDEFCKKNNLRRDVFKDVTSYLSEGDILGAYKKNLSQIDDLLERLKAVNKKLADGKSLESFEVWNLNNLYSESLFFGQFVAQVFGELTPKRSTSII